MRSKLFIIGLISLVVLVYIYRRNSHIPQNSQLKIAASKDKSSFSQPKNNIAVLEFGLVGDKKNVEDLSIGLADFMFLELQAKGLEIIERHNIQYILSERRLQQSGFVRTEDIIREKLPWVHYLVKGKIQSLVGNRFGLYVSLVDAFEQGNVVAEYYEEGRYPDELMQAVRSIANKIHTKINAGSKKRTGKLVKKWQGMTKTPEVAWDFYRGLNYYIAGKPEYSILYFRKAYSVDASFITAMVWEAKAYKTLGLIDHANWLHKKIKLNFPNVNLAMMYNGSSKNKNDKTIVVVHSKKSQKVQSRLYSHIVSSLSSLSQIRIFKPEWIKSLTEEMDLDITDQFVSTSVFKDCSWLAVDFILSIDTSQQDHDQKIILRLINAPSGELLYKREKIIKKSDNLPGLANQLVKDIWHTKLSKQNLQIKLTKKTPVANARYSLKQKFAEKLCIYALDRKNKNKLMALFNIITQYDRQYSEQYERQYDQQIVLLKQLQNLIAKNDPQAPYWLSTVLWHKQDLYHKIKTPKLISALEKEVFLSKKTQKTRTLAQDFAPLLQKYPESFPALLIKFSIAIKQKDMWSPQKTLSTLQQLTLALPKFNQRKLSYAFYVNLHFFTAQAASRAKQPAIAWKHLAQAYKMEKEHYIAVDKKYNSFVIPSKATPRQRRILRMKKRRLGDKSYLRKSSGITKGISFATIYKNARKWMIKYHYDKHQDLNGKLSFLYTQLQQLSKPPFPNDLFDYKAFFYKHKGSRRRNFRNYFQSRDQKKQRLKKIFAKGKVIFKHKGRKAQAEFYERQLKQYIKDFKTPKETKKFDACFYSLIMRTGYYFKLANLPYKALPIYMLANKKDVKLDDWYKRTYLFSIQFYVADIYHRSKEKWKAAKLLKELIAIDNDREMSFINEMHEQWGDEPIAPVGGIIYDVALKKLKAIRNNDDTALFDPEVNIVHQLSISGDFTQRITKIEQIIKKYRASKKKHSGSAIYGMQQAFASVTRLASTGNVGFVHALSHDYIEVMELNDNEALTLFIATSDLKGILKRSNECLKSKDFLRRYHGIIAKGKLVKFQNGLVKKAEFYQRELQRFSKDFSPNRYFYDLVLRIAYTCKLANLPNKALAVYQLGLQRKGSKAQKYREYLFSIQYYLANLYAKSGNSKKAITLLQELIVPSESPIFSVYAERYRLFNERDAIKASWLLFRGGSAYQAAIKKLKSLGGGVKKF